MPVVSRVEVLLKPWVTAVDKPGMSESNLLFDSLSDPNRLVLQAYADRSLAAKAASEDHDGWLDRLVATDGLEAEQLTGIHGELIALGMLKFELTNRQTGLRYRVSTRGMSMLERHAKSEEAVDSTVTVSATQATAHESPSTDDTEDAHGLADAA